MAKSPAQTAYEDWNKRIAKYQAAGIPASVYIPIANHDLTRVYQQGSQVMTNEEADTAIYAAANRFNPVAKSSGHGGLLGFLGNAAQDIGGIITSLPKLPVELAKDIGSPARWQHTGQDLAQALKDIGSPGQALRDLAKSQQLDLIPGLADVADLTTAAGREQLATHPVTSLLDILPIAKPLTAAAGASLAARAGEGALSDALATASRTDVLRGKVDLTKPRVTETVGEQAGGFQPGDPSALAALVAGKPVLAGLRAADRRIAQTVDPITGQAIGYGQLAARTALRRANLDTLNRRFASVMNQAQLTGEQVGAAEHKALQQSTFKELYEADNPDQAIEEYSRKAQLGDIASMTEVEKTVYAKEQELRQLLMAQAVERKEGKETPWGFFEKGHPVLKAIRRRDREAGKGAKSAEELAQAQNRLERAKAQHDRAIAQASVKATALAKSIADDERLLRNWRFGHQAAAQFLARINNNRAMLARETAKINQLKVSSTTAQELRRARNGLNTAIKTRRTHLNSLKKKDDQVTSLLMEHPPANLHPLIQHTFRQRAAKAYLEGQGEKDVNVNNLKDYEINSKYADVLKKMQTTAVMDTFNKYVGEAETQALWDDARREALKLAKEGKAPIYAHTLTSDGVKQALRVHVGATRDITEAQFKKRVLDLSSTVFNNPASLTREALNTIQRDGMQQVVDNWLTHIYATRADLEKTFAPMAHMLAEKGKVKYQNLDHVVDSLIKHSWSQFDFDKFGIVRGGHMPKGETIYIPREIAQNLESFSRAGGFLTEHPQVGRGYERAMGLFRVSVLYGPRHFAHVVIGGLAPLVLETPGSFRKFSEAYRYLHEIHGSGTYTDTAAKIAAKHNIDPAAAEKILQVAGTRFDYRTDMAFKVWQTKVGTKYGQLLKDYWAKTGAKPGEKLAQVENFAQSLYQLATALHDIDRGKDPMIALQHMRNVVVNLDGMSPFERTVMKQVMPFYSFTRYAAKFLVQLPFDHPLRVAVLSRLANQAQEEWGTGLPQTMMSLFFVGHPNAAGNIETVNLRNMNPFRSMASIFTGAGFIQSLNPYLQMPFIMRGFNPLEGSGALYPTLTFDPVSGTLKQEGPKGGGMLAAEQVVPELGGIDALFGITDNMRSLAASDKAAFDRQILNMFNIPFAVSHYNLPVTRGRVATNALKGAQQAVSDFRKTGDYAGTIGRYSLIPYQGKLYPPEVFKQFWEQEQAAVHAQFGPTAAAQSFIAKPQTTGTPNVLSELYGYYQNQGA